MHAYKLMPLNSIAPTCASELFWPPLLAANQLILEPSPTSILRLRSDVLQQIVHDTRVSLILVLILAVLALIPSTTALENIAADPVTKVTLAPRIFISVRTSPRYVVSSFEQLSSAVRRGVANHYDITK